MGRFREASGDDSGSSGIDISPLIDCVFILLIFFIVTTTFVEETGVEVDKPQAASAVRLEKNSILIALTEKGVAHRRHLIDLANKPAWFIAISPLGKVPLLRVEAEDGKEAVLFESAVICEYLEDTQPNPLHPVDPLARARHRAGERCIVLDPEILTEPDDRQLLCH